jgi:hypothetical protein
MEPTQAPVRHAPFSHEQSAAIRKQLERMLRNPLFKNSKRYPNLLRYVVEHTLEGDPTELRERHLGVQVFGREPDYDTNADPIVRATAGEIRKRIAQYYHEQGHEAEIRIELSPGSYVPEFEILAPAPTLVPIAVPAMLPASRSRTAALASSWRHWIRYIAVAATVAVLAGVAWLKPWTPHTALDRFWAPVVDSSGSVLLCVGQRRFLGSSPEPGQWSNSDLPHVADPHAEASGSITLFKLYYLGSENVALQDVTTLGRLNGLLQAKGKSCAIRGEISTSFADLRDGPVVLVGALNNDWTVRLTGPMRFSYERDDDTFWIKDRQNPSRRDRAVNYQTPYLDLAEDYALISRVLEPTTERMVVVAGGLTGFGTITAGEFLTNPNYMNAIAKQLPVNWEHKNIQLVLATKVIGGNSGPPQVVDKYVW